MNTPADPMVIYLGIVVGIALSVVLPILRALLPKPLVGVRAAGEWKRYVYTGIFSLLAGILLLAMTGADLQSWSMALVAGYTWDSTFQKFSTGNGSV